MNGSVHTCDLGLERCHTYLLDGAQSLQHSTLRPSLCINPPISALAWGRKIVGGGQAGFALHSIWLSVFLNKPAQLQPKLITAHTSSLHSPSHSETLSPLTNFTAALWAQQACDHLIIAFWFLKLDFMLVFSYKILSGFPSLKYPQKQTWALIMLPTP